MSEEIKKETAPVEQEIADENIDDGIPSKKDKNLEKQQKTEEPDMIARANFAAERLEKANAESKKLLEKQENLLIEQRLEGKGRAVPKKEPEKMSDREYAKAIMKGEVPQQ